MEYSRSGGNVVPGVVREPGSTSLAVGYGNTTVYINVMSMLYNERNRHGVHM